MRYWHVTFFFECGAIRDIWVFGKNIRAALVDAARGIPLIKGDIIKEIKVSKPYAKKPT